MEMGRWHRVFLDGLHKPIETIKYMEKFPVNIPLMDMLMEPGMNGYQPYREILKIRPRQKIVITSRFSESDDVKSSPGS